MSSTRPVSTRTHASLLKPLACMTILSAVTLLAPLHAAAQVSFWQAQYASGDTSSNSIVSGDFDNDGILDLVTSNNSTISFYKGLGGGKFASPVNTASTASPLLQAATADFNGDGKLDLAVASFYGSVLLFLGNGDGTFTFETTVGLPAGESITQRLVLADFNGDHIPDLVFAQCAIHGPGCDLAVYLGKGDGTFTQAGTLNNAGWRAFVAGDFNADGHQDIAALTIGGTVPNGVIVFFGDGTGQFQAPVTYDVAGNVDGLAAGDFYNNGIPSLVLATDTFDSSTGDDSIYIQSLKYSNGAFSSTQPQLVSSHSNGINSVLEVDLAAGDLNGDFKDDVVIAGGYGDNEQFQTPINAYMLGTGQGTFDAPVTLPAYGQVDQSPFIRDLDLDGRHDIGLDWSTDNQAGGGAFTLMNNSSFATNCTPPAATKLQVHVCGLANGQTISSPFTFQAAGNAFNGTVKRMELWMDGQKIGQNLGDQLSVSATVPQGTHTAGFVVVDSFDNVTSESVTFTSNGGPAACNPPSSPGVNVCTPTQNENVTSPVDFEFAATSATGKIDHFELWINGTKIGNYPGGSGGSISLTLSPGSYTATIVEVDSSFNYVKSAPVTFNVTGNSCGVPVRGGPGAYICSPTQNGVVTSPVNFVAVGEPASGTVNHLELWIDGQKIGNYPGAQMNTNVSVAPGAHQATVVEVDSNFNYLKSTPVNFTVSGGACSPPSSPGVNVCSPMQNAQLSSPVAVVAAGTGASGTVNHLELWIDGQKVGNYPGNQMNTTIGMGGGAHQATIVEVDSTYNFVKSTPVNFTVK